MTVVEDFLPIEVNDLDVILGMKWLQSIGKMETDWPALAMSFVRGDKRIMLKGDPSLARLEVCLKQLSKSWQATDEGYFVELRALTAQGGEYMEEMEVRDVQMPLEIHHLLQEYKGYFTNTRADAAQRAIDHKIQIWGGGTSCKCTALSVCPRSKG